MEEVRAAGTDARLVVGDVSTLEVARQAVETATGEFGRLDVLVNNAGIVQGDDRDTWDTSEETWDRLLRVNLRSVFVCSKAAIPVMRNDDGPAFARTIKEDRVTFRIEGIEISLPVPRMAAPILSRIDGGRSLGELQALLAKTPGSRRGLVGDLYGTWTIPALYLQAFVQSHPDMTADAAAAAPIDTVRAVVG